MSEFCKQIGKVMSKAITKIDHDLQELKLVYVGQPPEIRKSCLDWFRKVAELAYDEDVPPNISVRLGVSNEMYNQEGELGYSGGANLPPRLVVRACEAWDKGEEFTPTDMGIFQ